MAQAKFFANAATITVAGQTLGVAKGCEVNVTFEHVELYGLGSILRQGVSKHTARVEVTVSSAMFDPGLDAGIAKAYGYVLEGGSTKSTSITDTNKVALMNVTGLFTADDGATQVLLTVSGVYWENLPFVATENEYIVPELSGYGSQITIAPPT